MEQHVARHAEEHRGDEKPERRQLTSSHRPEPRNRWLGTYECKNRAGLKTQYYTATTLDGFIADASNSLDWLFAVDRGGEPGEREFDAFFAEVGAMAMGATTYEWVLDHERLLEQPERWRAFYGETPSWVFTHRALPAIPGADIRFVEGDVAPVHADMRKAAGEQNIWIVGGGDLVGQFADQGLLDEILVGVAPVTLGAGAPLLPRRLTSADLEMVDVSRDGQFARLRYRVTAR